MSSSESESESSDDGSDDNSDSESESGSSLSDEDSSLPSSDEERGSDDESSEEVVNNKKKKPKARKQVELLNTFTKFLAYSFELENVLRLTSEERESRLIRDVDADERNGG